MDIQWWQILLLTLYAGYQILDELQIYSSMSAPVFAGLYAGLVMGDLKAGLIIGGSMQLTVLGGRDIWWCIKIDANSGTILATAFSISLRDEPRTSDCGHRGSCSKFDDPIRYFGTFCEYVFCIGSINMWKQ